MKPCLLLFLVLFHSISNGQLLEQDFSASSTVSDYVNLSPGNSFFNSIGSSGAGVVVSINSNRLRYARAGANTGSFTRNTDMTGPPASLIVQFDLAVSGSTTPATSVALFYVGNNFSTTNTTEANADVFARFSVNTTSTDGNFLIRDITSGTNSSALSGTVRIWWVMNNSGASIDYTAPDGSIAAIATGKADIWGGNTLLFNDASVQTPTQTIADIKFVNNQGSQTIDIDNILIDPIPAVTASNAASDVTANSFTANWTTTPGVTGYVLDVSKMSDFSTYVSGYEGLYVPGSATSSWPVSGLLWGNTYYYRVRSVSAYGTGEMKSGPSNVTFVVTGILPVTFGSITVRQFDEGVEVKFNVEAESQVKHYTLQRSFSGNGFISIATTPSRNDSSGGQYRLFDSSPQTGLAFYRIVATNENGSCQFSNTITFRSGHHAVARLKLMGNPVTSDKLVFRADQVPDGKYLVTILSTSGEMLLRRVMVIRKGLMITIPLHRFRAGTYILTMKGVVQLSEIFVTGE